MPHGLLTSYSSIHICMTGWSAWINDNSPIGTDGDHEKMSKEELSSFCPGGEITDIECIDSDQGDDWKSLSEATCTVDDGLDCLNIPVDGVPPCRDYKIRYMCMCPGMSKVVPVSDSINTFIHLKEFSFWFL